MVALRRQEFESLIKTTRTKYIKQKKTKIVIWNIITFKILLAVYFILQRRRPRLALNGSAGTPVFSNMFLQKDVGLPQE